MLILHGLVSQARVLKAKTKTMIISENTRKVKKEGNLLCTVYRKYLSKTSLKSYLTKNNAPIDE